MLERAVALAATSSVIVVTIGGEVDRIRNRISRLTGGHVPRNLRVAFAGGDLEVVTGGAEHVLWDHAAHEVYRSRLSDELAIHERRAELTRRELEAHNRIEVES